MLHGNKPQLSEITIMIGLKEVSQLMTSGETTGSIYNSKVYIVQSLFYFIVQILYSGDKQKFENLKRQIIETDGHALYHYLTKEDSVVSEATSDALDFDNDPENDPVFDAVYKTLDNFTVYLCQCFARDIVKLKYDIKDKLTPYQNDQYLIGYKCIGLNSMGIEIFRRP